jgi:hypothetical protein
LAVISLSSTGQIAPDASDPEYLPGACNIGPAEIAYRRRWGHAGLVATLVTLAVLLWSSVPPLARFIVAFPAAAAAIGYLQAWLRFCAAYGALGVFNFGRLRDTQRVADRAARHRDRVRALQIFAAGAATGGLVGLVAVLLP